VSAVDPRASGRSTRRVAVVLGLDLAGAPRRDTGCCLLRGPHRVSARIAHSDDEIRSVVRAGAPDLIVVDAPLSLPRGRRTLEDRAGPHLRACDRELLRRGIRFFPLTLGPMRMLTERGMRLAAEWRAEGYAVVEGYPGASQDLLGIPRKGAGVGPLARGLRRLGLAGDLGRRSLTHDELDAATIAWVGREHLAGRSLVIGDPEEGLMVLPQPTRPATRSALRAPKVSPSKPRDAGTRPPR